jgi:pimeloyl-ACP methyl ester carboxylesterase
MLYLGGTKDYVSIIVAYSGQNQYVPDLKVVPLNTGHWVMEEDPDSVNKQINNWIEQILSN